MNEFGKNLREIRQRKGLSQRDLAKMTGISASAIGMYEQGRREPNTETTEALARALCVSPAMLKGWTGLEENDRFISYSTMDGIVLEIFKTTLELDNAARDRLLHYARFLLSEEHHGNED